MFVYFFNRLCSVVVYHENGNFHNILYIYRFYLSVFLLDVSLRCMIKVDIDDKLSDDKPSIPA